MKKQFSLLLTIVAVVLYFLSQSDIPLEKEDNVKRDEKYYQTKMCNEFGGKTEYILFDKTRVDCLTDEYAIEVDFAKKWAEGIGQSLYYAEITKKKPAIALIVGDGDEKYLNRVKTVADKFDIKIIVLDK
ncbi:MAG: hypothetical protein PHQ93_02270 [Sulfurimonas sp.]|uniref:hypothetical protein n=1 Tax=Sulfurimonas sp. TaxID=2022749 RepID=UPI0026329FFE|nr:hypothetical protein [Sulfurimonas sp.]MDD5399995.1 hypothetical protein [Sulfurimonas sp.]